MEFTTEFIEEHKLSKEQVKGITAFATDHIATLKSGWDTKANDNAEGILGGAIEHFRTENNVDITREQGEKVGDYFKRVLPTLISSQMEEVGNLKKDYETKLKEFKGGDALKSELEDVKQKYDEAQQKLANYDELTEKAGKYDETATQLDRLNLEVSFGKVKPNFPESVNSFEAAAKWDIFKKSVLEKYHVKLDDNKPIAVDKENHYKVIPLSDLVEKDETIQELVKGRQQKGPDAKPIDLEEIEGVPFKVPKDASGSDRSKLIRDHLEKQGIGSTHPKYSDKFKELNDKILQGKNQAA